VAHHDASLLIGRSMDGKRWRPSQSRPWNVRSPAATRGRSRRARRRIHQPGTILFGRVGKEDLPLLGDDGLELDRPKILTIASDVPIVSQYEDVAPAVFQEKPERGRLGL